MSLYSEVKFVCLQDIDKYIQYKKMDNVGYSIVDAYRVKVNDVFGTVDNIDTLIVYALLFIPNNDIPEITNFAIATFPDLFDPVKIDFLFKYLRLIGITVINHNKIRRDHDTYHLEYVVDSEPTNSHTCVQLFINNQLTDGIGFQFPSRMMSMIRYATGVYLGTVNPMDISDEYHISTVNAQSGVLMSSLSPLKIIVERRHEKLVYTTSPQPNITFESQGQTKYVLLSKQRSSILDRLHAPITFTHVIHTIPNIDEETLNYFNLQYNAISTNDINGVKITIPYYQARFTISPQTFTF